MSAATRLMQYVSLYQNTMIALTGIANNPMGWKLYQKDNPDGPKRAAVAAVDGMRAEWLNIDSDSLSLELEINTLSATDRAALVDVYKKRLKPIGIIENKAEYIAALDYGDCDNADVFKIKVEALIDEMNDINSIVAEALKPILGEPQPGEGKRPLMQITQEAIDGLKPYFVSTFKGMGNNNPDRFNENLIPALQRCKTKKEIAALALACYKSGAMIKDRKPSWNKWLTEWCNLFSIDRLPYKKSELPPPDYGVKYYWLTTNKK